MRIWLFHPANQLPGDGVRSSRIDTLAQELVSRGHECVYWTATFSHHLKVQRASGWTDFPVSPGYTVRLIPTPSYGRHVGAARLRFHAALAYRFWRRGRTEPPPDCIVANDAPLGDSLAALALARRHHAALVLDVTDEWPDHFVLAFPRRLRWLAGRLLFAPLYCIRRYARQRAAAITALSAGYLPAIRRDLNGITGIPVEVFYNGIDGHELRDRMAVTRAALGAPERKYTAIYAGTLGGTYDIPAIVEAAQILKARNADIRIIVAGDGPMRPLVEAEAARPDSRLTYVGKVSLERLAALYGASHIGLAAYAAGSTVGMPDKAYDYLAAGLPVVNSIRGELASWLLESGAGVQYTPGRGVSLADAIGSIAADPKRLEEMSRAASALSERFDRVTQYSEFATLVLDVARDVPTRSNNR